MQESYCFKPNEDWLFLITLTILIKPSKKNCGSSVLSRVQIIFWAYFDLYNLDKRASLAKLPLMGNDFDVKWHKL